jgi:hypothetical protein
MTEGRLPVKKRTIFPAPTPVKIAIPRMYGPMQILITVQQPIPASPAITGLRFSAKKMTIFPAQIIAMTAITQIAYPM